MPISWHGHEASTLALARRDGAAHFVRKLMAMVARPLVTGVAEGAITATGRALLAGLPVVALRPPSALDQAGQVERAGNTVTSDQEREKDDMLQQADGGDGDRAGLRKVVVPDNYCTQAAYRRAVGRRLRTARVVLNISQQDVADAAGCSRNFVSGIERGAQGVDAYRLSLVALALRMRPRTLMEGDGWDSWMNGMQLGADE
jgi:hypothetical protein